MVVDSGGIGSRLPAGKRCHYRSALKPLKPIPKNRIGQPEVQHQKIAITGRHASADRPEVVAANVRDESVDNLIGAEGHFRHELAMVGEKAIEGSVGVV